MNILCFVAHPDDETMLCGGTLALLAARGAKVHVACLTRGEGGEMGEPPLTTREQLGNIREAELVSAVQALGGSSLTFLGYRDPVVGPEDALFAPEHDAVMLAGQIVNTIKQFKAGVVIGHGSNGEYGHPAHVLMHQMTLAAIATLRQEGELSPLPSLYTFSAMYPNHPYPRLANKDDNADIVVNVSSVLDKKESAALAHKTQNALFVRRRSQELGRAITVRESLLPTEALHRIFGEPGDEFSKLLTT